jgi:hypothetical protein
MRYYWLRHEMVSTKSLVPGRFNPVHRTDLPLVREIRQSMESDGFWGDAAITVARDGISVGDGHRRLRAAIEVGITEVPISVSSDPDPRNIFLRNLLGRRNMNGRDMLHAVRQDSIPLELIPFRYRKHMLRTIETVGTEGLIYMADHDFSPSNEQWIGHAADALVEDIVGEERSIDRNFDILRWIVSNAQMRRLRTFLDMRRAGRWNAEELAHAIEENRPLRIF